jgi:hypothetical protein
MFEFFPQKAIAQDEYGKINRTIWTMVSNQCHRPLPPILYHYTDAAGLQGIVESGAMRATHMAFMNDATEYRYAVSLLHEAVKHQKSRNAEQPTQLSLLEEIEAFLEGPAPELNVPYFVACFSEQENSLNQWRAYGRGEGGFSIGFDASLLQTAGVPKMCLLAPAVYDRQIQDLLVRQLLAWALNEYPRTVSKYGVGDRDEHRRNWAHVLLWELTAVAPMMKNPAFVEEKEWRLIHRSASQASVRFAPRLTGLVAFVDIKLGLPQTGTQGETALLGRQLPDRLPIKVLWSGPGRATKQSLEAGRTLLGQNGYVGIPVFASEIPYRVG